MISVAQLRLLTAWILRTLRAWRSGASVQRVLAALRRVRDADELRAVERDLLALDTA